jgi:hypothetical protein
MESELSLLCSQDPRPCPEPHESCQYNPNLLKIHFEIIPHYLLVSILLSILLTFPQFPLLCYTLRPSHVWRYYAWRRVNLRSFPRAVFSNLLQHCTQLILIIYATCFGVEGYDQIAVDFNEMNVYCVIIMVIIFCLLQVAQTLVWVTFAYFSYCPLPATCKRTRIADSYRKL